jgi:ferritin-like metal-binding protein YciE
MAEDIKERIIRYLQDAHAAEEGAISSMRSTAEEATNSNFKTALEEHISVTESQAQRLADRIKALGSDKSSGKSLVNSLIAKGSDLVNVFHDREDKQTQDAIKLFALENFEIATYTSLKAFSDAAGDYETAQLAATILAEEQLAAERILRVLPELAQAALGRTTATKL